MIGTDWRQGVLINVDVTVDRSRDEVFDAMAMDLTGALTFADAGEGTRMAGTFDMMPKSFCEASAPRS